MSATTPAPETPWGHVLVWEPPARLVLAWQLDGDHRYDPELITEVEITFHPVDGGTEVRLEHRNLEARFGKKAHDLGGRHQPRAGPREVGEFAAYADLPEPGGMRGPLELPILR